MSQRRPSNPPRRPQGAERRQPVDARSQQSLRRRSSRGVADRVAWRFNRRSPYAQFTAIAAAFSLLLVLVLVVLGVTLYVAWIVGWSIVTFFFYGFDKRNSKLEQRGNRVPEDVLHFLSLIGGFPGGWAGRAYYRHKTLHTSFLITLIISTALHLGFALWLFRGRLGAA